MKENDMQVSENAEQDGLVKFNERFVKDCINNLPLEKAITLIAESITNRDVIIRKLRHTKPQ